MKKQTITLTLDLDAAEKILREAAQWAAFYSSCLDFITRKTYNTPQRTGETLEAARERWHTFFVKHKRMVEAFGVEFSPVSEAETITIGYPYTKGGKRERVKVAGIAFDRVTGAVRDYKRPVPEFRRAVHGDACHAAADRTVRAWRQSLSTGAEHGNRSESTIDRACADPA